MRADAYRHCMGKGTDTLRRRKAELEQKIFIKVSTPVSTEETLAKDSTISPDGDLHPTMQERKRQLSLEQISDVGGPDSGDSRPPAKMGRFDLDS